MRKHCSFTALPGAVIQIGSMTDLKRYLMAKRPEHHGLKVDRYIVVDDEVRARLLYPDGTKSWSFYGYLEDVAQNIQKGFLEETAHAQS